MLSKLMPLSGISIGNRHRKDMGDLDALAASIKEHGLLQPIGINRDNRLVFGARRLKAAESLGWKQVPCVVVDVTSIVAGEYEENEMRKNFTLSERDAIRKAIEEEIGRRQGKRTDMELPGKCPEVADVPERGQETRDFAAKKAGFRSTDEARRVRTAVSQGTPELVKAMDDGDISPSAAARISRHTPDKQREIVIGSADEPEDAEPTPAKLLGVGVLRANEAIDALKRIPKNDPLRKRGFQIVTDWIKAHK